MIVFQIDVDGVTILESKRNSPVRSYADRPNAFTGAFELMQPKRRLIHVLGTICLIQG